MTSIRDVMIRRSVRSETQSLLAMTSSVRPRESNLSTAMP